ncbi:MAG: S-layer homology domain-containing protein [Oscillospiraceae bacterium]|nr:S-layer homology domain-containing protein [Oscillospiraceae bacterium]
MNAKRIIALALAAVCATGVCWSAYAAEVDSDTTYCFTAGDFAAEELAGICITQLPDPSAGTVMLGNRVLRSGDILTAQQLAQLVFIPVRTEEDREAVVTYLPIYENRVESATTMTISIRGKEDKAPVAQDSALETYKNLPIDGKLSASDPEGGAMTYTVIRSPKRGEVSIRPDGTFTYTPKKNKVGTDSFTYTATDAAGNVSREATVTIELLKPTTKTMYTDTLGLSCRFAAEWMKNTGLFVGETVGNQSCFQPEKQVTRGEFVTMLVQSLGLPVDEDVIYTGFSDDVPTWLKPYLAAAMRSGLTAGWPHGTNFGASEPISGAEAALMVQNALDLPLATVAEDSNDPDWAAAAMATMAQNGVAMENAPMTRAQVSEALYQVSRLAPSAPGMAVFAQQ